MRTVSKVWLASAILLVAGVLARPAAAQQGGAKIAYVNTQLILQQTPGYAQAESTFKKEVEGYRTEVQQLQAKLDSAAAAFDRDAVLLSPSAREAKRKELSDQQTSLEGRTQELRDRASQRQQELMDPIESRISTVINGLRAEGNYSMIFDIAVLGNGVLAADKSLDLTDTVIKRLQPATGK